MPRKPLKRIDTLPYHVTARVNNREEFPLAPDRFWNLMGNQLHYLTIVYGIEIHSLVLMPNHFHLLLTVPQHDLGKIMNVFISPVTRMSNLISGRSGHLFGGPYHWSLINNSRYFGHAFKYVYRNPVRAQLCDRVENYPYSTLHGLFGLSRLPFPLHWTRVGLEAALPTVEDSGFLDWLNTPFPTEEETLIKRGLRKTLFDAIRERHTRLPSKALDQLL